MADRKLASAVAGKSARACDNCGRKRARWYCAADDAFLCQLCDAAVHSANSLARRHERVRLKTASSSSSTNNIPFGGSESPPSWHQGFTRKARTPRGKKRGGGEFVNSDYSNPLHRVVPEIGGEEQYCENDNDEINEEEQLLFRVPILDPLIFEQGFEDESKAEKINDFISMEITSEVDAEFTEDVGCLLGKGLEDESLDMEELMQSERLVKVEDDEVGDVIAMAQENDYYRIDVEEPTFELNFDFELPIISEEEYQEENRAQNDHEPILFRDDYDCSKSFLKLDYEGVISAWDGQKSPWTTGERPEISSANWWPDCLGTSTHGSVQVYGEMGMTSGHAAMADRGREARVSRYREKRRTRLFSKKIRYEVRKLNAEKRPRMKGRFVKRSVNFAPPHVFSPSLLS